MARKVIDIIKNCLDRNKSFILEAGAGAGKTYTLMKTIDYIQTQDNKNYKILCITYTNVAKDEIISRLKKKSNIIVNTMHEFIWEFINKYQIDLKKEVFKLIEKEKNDIEDKIKRDKRLIEHPRSNTNIERKNEEIIKNKKKLAKYDDVNFDTVVYDSYKALYNGVISHDEVIYLFCEFLKNDLFVQLFVNTFTHIFIDEYQDTNKKVLLQLINCLNKYNSNKHVVLGLFGDTMQQIYSNDSLEIDYEKYNMEYISKKDNYRSCKEIIDTNNVLRMDGFKQECKNKNIKVDKIKFIYNLNDDLYLKKYGDIEISEYKRLFLSHKEIAEEVGFKNISQIYSEEYGNRANDKLLKLQDTFIKTIMETIIVYINNFNDNNYKDIILKYDSKYFNKKSLETLKVNIENIISKDNSLKIIIEQLRILGVIKTAKIEKVIKTYKNRGKSDFINKLYINANIEM